MTATFYVGDAVSVMNRLPEKSVDLVLTSPPFLALRSYLPADHPDKALEGGSQATPGEFIDWLLDVVDACDRVLAPHGSLCIELGDTYAGSGGAGGDYNADGLREGQPKFKQTSGWHRGTREGREEGAAYRKEGTVDTSLQNGGTGWPLAKSLSLIPELFRFTLVYGFNPLTGRQTERWRLRNVVRWVRPNPPVGALGDKFRPATSELMVFCKSAKRYFDLDAVRSEHQTTSVERSGRATKHISGRLGQGDGANPMFDTSQNPNGAPPLDWWEIPLPDDIVFWCEEHNSGNRGSNHGCYDECDQSLAHSNAGVTPRPCRITEKRLVSADTGAPPLDWWNIPPGGYEGAHYAVFPPELCVKPVKAMCPEKVCRVCGEPSRRIVEDVVKTFADGNGRHTPTPGQPTRQTIRTTSENRTLGFTDCGHGDYRPGLVLDPFGGSGTTALVATGHGRDAILIDLDERNYDLALERVGPLVLSKGEVAA